MKQDHRLLTGTYKEKPHEFFFRGGAIENLKRIIQARPNNFHRVGKNPKKPIFYMF